MKPTDPQTHCRSACGALPEILCIALLGCLVPSVSLAAESAARPASATCPLVAAQPAVKAPSAPVTADENDCLTDANAMNKGDVFDLRSRAEFIEFHVPGAQHSTVAVLTTSPLAANQNIILYDSGKFRSDAFMLCSRLRRAGLKRFKIVDGGVAAWTQQQHQPEKLALSRLSDAEVSAALFDPQIAAIALTASLKLVLKEHRIRQTADRVHAARKIFIVDPSTPVTQIDALLDGKNATSFYWIGDHQKLVGLLHAHLAQDQKRVAGPAESRTCSAL